MKINRREFLKLAGINVAALLIPPYKPSFGFKPLSWPSLSLENLSPRVKMILERVPKTTIDDSGYLNFFDGNGFWQSKAPLLRTYWNLERNRPIDRLEDNAPWGIVVHWYGDKDNFDKTAEGYLRGFDSIRLVDDYYTRTSAHFLVADGTPISEIGTGNVSGILQTQAPDIDGTPFLASHLQGIDYQAHRERKQYFVRALYQLSYEEPTIHSILQDFFDGPFVDPNLRTIAIELTGYGFENPENFPSDQQIANVISVIWAVMKRYNISAMNILGHHEIQLGKADPGKKFLSLIRFLIGMKALIEHDEKMQYLVFGQFFGQENNPQQAVQKYFKFIRDYLMLVGRPQQVYEWEALCSYWFVYDTIANHIHSSSVPLAETFIPPLGGSTSQVGNKFLIPENHEGVDLQFDLNDNNINKLSLAPVQLIARGKCVYAGDCTGLHPGKLAMFRHRQPDGAEVVTVFGHLKEFGALKIGDFYPQGYPIGNIESHKNHPAFLHFAIAYGATWDLDLHKNPNIPPNAGFTWIQERYLEPYKFLHGYNHLNPNQQENRFEFE